MRKTNLIILLIAVLIASFGILSIYSSTAQKEGKFWEWTYKRQIFWVILGIVCFMAISNLDYRHLWDAAYILYALGLFLLFLVFMLGVIRLGAQRWLKFAWFNLQPSEIAKLTVLIFLARYFSRRSISDVSLLAARFGIYRGLILPFIFAAIPAGLIMEQPDLGSAIIVLLIFTAMLYLSRLKLRYIAIFVFTAVLSCPFMWHFLKDYQKERLLVFLNPNIDPLGAGYTVIQSRIAIGSGGLLGKGWLSGTQSQLRFLPESHTDFIFATFAEEWGMAGCFVLLFLYFILVRWGITIGQRTHDTFGKMLAYGISFMLCVQVFINIAMNLGFAPVVGIPLPLMSYGGSSVLINFIALGILANINKRSARF